jgi:hypothetical protein
MIAAIRPDSWNFPLFLHVLGAMVLVGGLLTGGAALSLARDSIAQLRLGYYALLLVGLPGLVLMRIGAQWIYTKEGWDDVEDEPAWIVIGGITADIGGVIFILSLIGGYFGLRRAREGGSSWLLKATTWVALGLLAAYVVATWAMSAKPD